MTQIFKLIQILIVVGGNPLVQKFVDNMVKGTTTKVDDWVWSALKLFLGGASTDELESTLKDVQTRFDADKSAAKQPAPVEVSFG